jgi:aspartyl-tRNA(Asn)/glutamyl-tRNA(Gln) amidotransferase subunit A
MSAAIQEPWRLTLREGAERIRTGALASSDLVASVLERLEAAEPHISAFEFVDRDAALEAAAQLDGELERQGPRGPLHGIPLAIKDIFDVEGVPTRCGSRAFAGAAPASADSTAVARLRAAGAVIVGKTRTHELACGVYTAPACNPWSLERSPGGSSGGSGAAVAVGAAMGATGSDTGGSIRIPAALCGVVGIKPTYGRVSRAGVAALSWSLDHVGPLARTVDDAALLLHVMAGSDPRDPTAADRPVPDFLEGRSQSLTRARIGVPGEAFLDAIQPEVQAAVEFARGLLDHAGATVIDISIPELAAALAAEYAIVLAEAASYHEELIRTRAESIGDDVRVLLEAGTLLPSSVYLGAQRTRTALKQAFRRAFGEHELTALLAPTVPATAQLHDQATFEFDGEEEGVPDSFVRTTGPFNLTGLPTVALPVDLSSDGLPIGIQLAGPPFEEEVVVGIARAFEQLAGWREKHLEPAGLAHALRVRNGQLGASGDRATQSRRRGG